MQKNYLSSFVTSQRPSQKTQGHVCVTQRSTLKVFEVITMISPSQKHQLTHMFHAWEACLEVLCWRLHVNSCTVLLFWIGARRVAGQKRLARPDKPHIHTVQTMLIITMCIHLKDKEIGQCPLKCTFFRCAKQVLCFILKKCSAEAILKAFVVLNEVYIHKGASY